MQYSPSIENVFAFLCSRCIVDYKTADCQIGTLGQLSRNKMASKMTAKNVFHSKRICIVFILLLNCSQTDKPYGKLISLHQKTSSTNNQTKSLVRIPYKWPLKGGNYIKKMKTLLCLPLILHNNSLNICLWLFLGYNQYWQGGSMVFVVLCLGAPEGSNDPLNIQDI